MIPTFLFQCLLSSGAVHPENDLNTPELEVANFQKQHGGHQCTIANLPDSKGRICLIFATPKYPARWTRSSYMCSCPWAQLLWSSWATLVHMQKSLILSVFIVPVKTCRNQLSHVWQLARHRAIKYPFLWQLKFSVHYCARILLVCVSVYLALFTLTIDRKNVITARLQCTWQM